MGNSQSNSADFPSFLMGGHVADACQNSALDLRKLRLNSPPVPGLTVRQIAFKVTLRGETPERVTKLGDGANGDVMKLAYKGGAEVALKSQPFNKSVLQNLQVASNLNSCDLVEFRVEKFGDRLLTFMPVFEYDLDAVELKMGWRKANAANFIKFLRSLLHCLENNNACFPDMKLGNVTYCGGTDGTAVFRIIDVDGINGHVATYPALRQWTVVPTTGYGHRDGIVQTKYACAVSAMLFLKPRNWTGYAHGPALRSFSANAAALRKIAKNLGNDTEIFITEMLAEVEDYIEEYFA
jgi:hypothetical protein